MITYSKPFRLSVKGSTRATAYDFGNKIVTINGKMHVVWLDAVSQVCGRTYDHTSGTWGETVELFEGCDNHTNPALAVGRDGRLHLAFGPHGWWGNWNSGCFKYVVSETENSIEAWEKPVSFGYNATYASLVATPSGPDCIVYRGGDPPSPLMFQKQRDKGGWTPARALMRQEIAPQYTHLGATVVCDVKGTLYVGGHFYNLNTDGRSTGVAVLKSEDVGETWTNVRGEVADVPVLYGDRIAVPHKGEGDIRLAGMALDSKGGLWMATSSADCGQLSHWTGSAWKTIDLKPFLPGDRMAGAGPIVIDTQDRIHMAVGLNLPVSEDESWGHAGQEVFHLVSTDGGESFICNRVSIPDNVLPSWLPSISMGGVYQPVEKPVILYTHGDKGEGCSPETKTEVYCVQVEEID